MCARGDFDAPQKKESVDETAMVSMRLQAFVEPFGSGASCISSVLTFCQPAVVKDAETVSGAR